MMQVFIKDDQGLGTALMMEGCSRLEIQEAKQIIRTQFKTAANKVFVDVLGKLLPETIMVDMAQNDNDELKGNKAVRMASFNSELSHNDYLVFTIREMTIKAAMKQSDNELFRSTVIHEMIHAADQPVLEKNRKLFADLRNEIYATASDFFDKQNNDAWVALINTLQMFDHYRAEGIAILGEHLLTKRRFKAALVDSLEYFRRVYELTLMKSKNWALGSKGMGRVFDDNTYGAAYSVAPSILLLVFARKGEEENELGNRVLEGLNNGDFGLKEQEMERIIRTCLSLSLSDYIQGVVSLGEKVAPVKPFLEFCAFIQKDYENDNITAFSHLLTRPQTTDEFHGAMRQIMGCVMDEDEIDCHYRSFVGHPSDGLPCHQMKEKVERLYGVLKNDGDDTRKHIAQWALTYLFDDQDLIHDDVKGLGYVDDMAVVDYALRLIGD